MRTIRCRGRRACSSVDAFIDLLRGGNIGKMVVKV
jgi:NADPH-dependent curcumin reductase CurA